MTIYGTSYFRSQNAAERYFLFLEAHEDWVLAREIVQSKLDEGLIHIGRPPIPIGMRLELIDDGTRYALVESEEVLP